MQSSSFSGKSVLGRIFALAGVACVATTAADARATFKWGSDGSLCIPSEDYPLSDINWTSGGGGFSIYGSQTAGSRKLVCPIFTGPGLTQLSDSAADTIHEVRLHLRHTTSSSPLVYTDLVAHDFDSDSYCTCDLKSVAQGGGFFVRSLLWDALSSNCTSCTGGQSRADNWALTVSVSAASSLQLKRISVYDDT